MAGSLLYLVLDKIMNNKYVYREAALEGESINTASIYFVLFSVAMTPACNAKSTVPKICLEDEFNKRFIRPCLQSTFHNARTEKLPAISDIPTAQEGFSSYVC